MKDCGKYWSQRISIINIDGYIHICDAVIWKSDSSKLKIKIAFKEKEGSFKSKSAFTFSVKNGKLNLFAAKKKPEDKTKWTCYNKNLLDFSFPLSGAPKASLKFVRAFNFFAKINKIKKINWNTIRKEFREIETPSSKYQFLSEEGKRCLDKETRDNLWSVVQKSIECKIYPSSHLFPKALVRFADSGCAALLKKKSTLEDFVKYATGYKTKKIFRILAEESRGEKANYFFKQLANLRAFKGLVPIDFLYNLQAHHYDLSGSFRKILKNVSLPTRKSILNDIGKGASHFLFTDSARQYEDLNFPEIPKNLKGIEEIHGWITRERRNVKVVLKEIKYSEKIEKIHKVQVDDLTIELPQDTVELHEYGESLNHCIGSYGNLAVEKKCILPGIYKNGELKYTLEIRNREIKQFKGNRNRPPESEDEVKIRRLLEQFDIIDTPGAI